MGKYNTAVMTELGEQLLTKALNGHQIRFTQAKTSQYRYESDVDLKGLTEFQQVIQCVQISSAEFISDSVLRVRAIFSNADIEESYFIQNIGLYASLDGGDEALFSVNTADTPDLMPAYDGVAPTSFIYDIQFSIQQSENLSVNVNPAGVATAKDILDIQEMLGAGTLATTEQTIISAINEVAAVAKGKNRARVFATTESMNAWLANPANAGAALVGDNLYIVDVGVPDWWISKVLNEPDEDGRYYKIAQLEGQKIDLTTYDKKIATINTELSKKVTTGSQAKLYNVGLGNSDTALIYSEGDDVNFRFKGKNGDTLFTNLKNITGDINVLADRGRGYVELCSLWSNDNSATLTKPVDNILGYSYLLFCFIYGNKFYDTKLIPAKLFTEVMKFTGALRLHKANGEDVAAEVWWDGSQICTYINTGSHVVRVYGIA